MARSTPRVRRVSIHRTTSRVSVRRVVLEGLTWATNLSPRQRATLTRDEVLGRAEIPGAWSSTAGLSTRVNPTLLCGAGTVRSMSLLVATHDVFIEHLTGPGHPERPARLGAVLSGLSDLDPDAISWVSAPVASDADLHRVHPAKLLSEMDELCARGGGSIDPDTSVSPKSAEAARRAAGAGLELVDCLDRGEGDVGWSVVRPPGHHALSDRQMGFCLINNVAVTAAKLAERGERVAIVDLDAHHGNGTEAIFYDNPNVLFVSTHQGQWYPFTGAVGDVGVGQGRGANVNVPLPAGSAGDALRLAFDEVVGPVLERFAPTWVLISAGFDGHRDDPLAQLGFTSTDYAEVMGKVLQVAAPGKRMLFLEGGYDLDALRLCTAAVGSAALGLDLRPEETSSAGLGSQIIAEARSVHLGGGAGDL